MDVTERHAEPAQAASVLSMLTCGSWRRIPGRLLQQHRDTACSMSCSCACTRAFPLCCASRCEQGVAIMSCWLLDGVLFFVEHSTYGRDSSCS